VSGLEETSEGIAISNVRGGGCEVKKDQSDKKK
jgi:hypothetical protein